MTGNINKQISSLPLDIRRRISVSYNWNRCLIPALERALQDATQPYYVQREGYGYAQDGFQSTIDRLEWWLHLIKTDGRNWRLRTEGEHLLSELADLNLNGVVDTLAELLDYNTQFFDDPPIIA